MSIDVVQHLPWEFIVALPEGRMARCAGLPRAVSQWLVRLLERGPVDPLDQRLCDRAERPELARVRADLVAGAAPAIGGYAGSGEPRRRIQAATVALGACSSARAARSVGATWSADRR